MIIKNKKMTSKTKTLTTVALLSVIVLSIIPIQNVLGQIDVSTVDTVSSPPSLSDEFLLSAVPTKLSEKDLVGYRDIVIHDANILAMINGQPFKFSSEGFIGNIYQPNSAWYPEIHITVETKSGLYQDIAIVLDPQTKSIKKTQIVEFDPSDQNGLHNAYSTQRFTGSTAAPDGIKVNLKAPTFVWDNITRAKGNALLLNGLMTGSTCVSACTSSSIPSTYWAQIGFYWNSAGKINWTDTQKSCLPQFPTLSYVSGKTYEFRIVGATTGWAYYAIRTDTGETFTTRGPVVNSSTMQTPTTNDGTSVFFENKYSTSDPSWSGQFSTSPQASTAQYKTTPFGTYSNWSSTMLLEKNCSNTNFVYPYDITKQVMSGNLVSGGSATWSVSKMQTYYPNC